MSWGLFLRGTLRRIEVPMLPSGRIFPPIAEKWADRRKVPPSSLRSTVGMTWLLVVVSVGLTIACQYLWSLVDVTQAAPVPEPFRERFRNSTWALAFSRSSRHSSGVRLMDGWRERVESVLRS